MKIRRKNNLRKKQRKQSMNYWLKNNQRMTERKKQWINL